jgi:hypothetical protein
MQNLNKKVLSVIPSYLNKDETDLHLVKRMFITNHNILHCNSVFYFLKQEIKPQINRGLYNSIAFKLRWVANGVK